MMSKSDYAEIMRRNGLSAVCWVILEDHEDYLIVRRRIKGDVKKLDK